MKKITPWLVLAAVVVFELFAFNAMAQTPSITPPLRWSQTPMTPAQAQASAQAAEAAQPHAADLKSVLVVIQCNVAVSVVDIDDTGTVHEWDLDGRTKTDLTDHLQSALSAGAVVKSDNVGCPGTPAKDTTVL